MLSAEPLINPYLWALGSAATAIAPGTDLHGRYRVIAPQVWLDTQPDRPIEPVEEIHHELLPYLYLYQHRLHLPIVYDVCKTAAGTVVLLENVPLEGAGSLQPSLTEASAQASGLRQVNWFWQILQLWEPLCQIGVAASLLVPDNLRIEGWRVRLRELYAGMGEEDPLGSGLDRVRYQGDALRQPDLVHLGRQWSQWAQGSHTQVRGGLLGLGERLQSPDASYDEIKAQLNQFLLEQTAQNPVRLQVAGYTDAGPQRTQNEDTGYPMPQDLRNRGIAPDSQLIPHVAIVCDGLGGHEGGEVASQLAVRTLKLQMQALLNETLSQTHLLPPELVMQQMAASIRVVNNLIDAKNNEQAREARQRMGTTLVLAVHLQQPIGPNSPPAHEIYLASVGDSRIYWMTNRYCQCLTVDDDLACREVRLGRSLYRDALQRSDAGALTQALGTRDGEQLHVNLQRFVLDEDGLLFLCSDGVSDNGLVECSWAETVNPILGGTQALEEAAQHWVEMANVRNGHDNASVVLSRCRVTPEYPVLLGSEAIAAAQTPAESLTEASEALLASSEAPATEIAVPPEPRSRRWGWLGQLVGVLAVLGIGGGIGYVGIQQLMPGLFGPVPRESPPPAPESPAGTEAAPPDLQSPDLQSPAAVTPAVPTADPSPLATPVAPPGAGLATPTP